jgi:hypothetical protein
MTSCLQYYYENEEDREKYSISCDNKVFSNLNDVETFNNKDLLDFIKEKYIDAFTSGSPFEFKKEYINLDNDQICKAVDMSLAPQQKFMGQIMGPNSNFNNMLIFHGLGSGKSCTSIVIGEALKNATNKRLLFVVPAPLVDQYFEEISGEIRNGKFFSCPSFCVVKNGGNTERDFYVSQQQNTLLIVKLRSYASEQNKLNEINKEIDLYTTGNIPAILAKKFKDQENKINLLKRQLDSYQKDLRTKIIRTFDIVTHQTFIDSLYKTGKDGQFIKGARLLEDTALFNENGLLIIDEIQRLVSSSGIFYKKLYNAIKYYFHPKLKIAVMSATPIYDNPYELALTINLLRPRIPFPINESDFYKFFVGEYENDECVPSKKSKTWISEDSCIINKDLLSLICSGYVSYFKGGNPNAYPYKRIITMEHSFSSQHKQEYIAALKSDLLKDKNFGNKKIGEYENVLLGNYESESEDKISGMYVTTQQYSNIFLPKIGENINKTVQEKKQALSTFKSRMASMRFQNPTDVITYIKTFSNKFASIIELALNSNGPVFIFSNWLTYGVEPLSIILEACGLSRFDREDKGRGRYFVWSSETKTMDKDGILIKKARNTFNSMENSDGSKLKIILGTRSVMEGVSFKNVKQVHITEPWWNEARIEQILARASRYCSHSNLSAEEQYVDIYRHYSVLSSPVSRDDDISAILTEFRIPDSQGLSTYSIDQKMLMSSLKKYSINNELEGVLKNCSIDSEINANGNIIRIEEHAIPISSGLYQIYYKNPSNGRTYIRDGIPENVTFTDIYERKFSYPNKNLPLKFTEAAAGENSIFKPYPDPEILEPPYINEDLNIKEGIVPWRNENTFQQLNAPVDVKEYMADLYKKYNLIPILRKNYFSETGNAKIKFVEDSSKRFSLIKCIKELASSELVPSAVKKQIAQQFNKESQKLKINAKVLELIYVYKLYPESQLEELLEVAAANPGAINEILKAMKNV